MYNQEEDDDMIYVGDIEEEIDTYETEEIEDEDAVEEAAPEKGDEVCMFTGHKPSGANSKNILGSVFCGSMTKDGKLAATGGEDDQAYVWDTSTGEILLHCTGHIDSVITAEFNYDESHVVTGDMSGMIQVWRLSDKVKIWDYTVGTSTRLEWVKCHHTANVVLAGCFNGELYMWKVPNGNCKVFHGYGHKAGTAAIFPDGKRIAVGYEDGIIRVIDLKTGSVLSCACVATGLSATITTIDCHLDNNLVIFGIVNGKTIISASNMGKTMSVLQNLNNGVNNHHFNDDDAGSNDGNESSNWVESAAFCKDPTFQVAATGTVNGEIFIWDISKQTLRHEIQLQSGVSKLLWRGSTSILFAAGLDGVLRCFDGKSGQCLHSFTGHTAGIFDVCISEDGKKALTASDDSTARIFDISFLS